MSVAFRSCLKTLLQSLVFEIEGGVQRDSPPPPDPNRNSQSLYRIGLNMLQNSKRNGMKSLDGAELVSP